MDWLTPEAAALSAVLSAGIASGGTHKATTRTATLDHDAAKDAADAEAYRRAREIDADVVTMLRTEIAWIAADLEAVRERADQLEAALATERQRTAQLLSQLWTIGEPPSI